MSRTKWEYQFVVSKHPSSLLQPGRERVEIIELANPLGEEGWEIVNTVPIASTNGFTSHLLTTFKREKEEA